MYHYTYMSSDNHLFYIGVRSSKKHPDFDKYLGSFKNKTFKPIYKTVLSFHETRRDALQAEIYWQHLFKVVENSLFINKAYQTSTGFSRQGCTYIMKEETKQKIANALKGKAVSKETRDKMSKAAKKRKRFPTSRKTKRKLSKAIKNNKKHLASCPRANNAYQYNHIEYIFYNFRTKTFYQDTLYNFCINKNVDRSNANKLIKGKIKHLKGWCASCLIVL